jgi:aldose 1-epimerase
VTIDKKYFGTTADAEIYQYTLSNDRGYKVSIITYGGAITSLWTPDRNGTFGDVVLGFDSLEAYTSNPLYFGALIGRHANRIAQGRFTLDGVEYQLPRNDDDNHLHGGFRGFDKRVWTAREGDDVLHLSYFSKDGEEGYPGNVEAFVDFRLSDGELRLEYRATTDRDTIVNLTNHSYFNLKGAGTILDHELTLHAGNFTPVSDDLIPTGEIAPVAGTPMDFCKGRAIGSEIGAIGGYDHNFCLNYWDGSLRSASRLYEPESGRVLEILTTEPGMQFYSGNFLDGSFSGKNGVVYVKYAGLCLEPQHFPDAPNHPNFPSTVLRPGEEYWQTSVYRFSTAD